MKMSQNYKLFNTVLSSQQHCNKIKRVSPAYKINKAITTRAVLSSGSHCKVWRLHEKHIPDEEKRMPDGKSGDGNW